MSDASPKRRLPVPGIVGACLLLAGLWVASFLATGLMWWRASDLYDDPVPRPAAIVPEGSIVEAYETQRAEDAQAAATEASEGE
ncbi:MAG: hypothetical protein GF320_11710 [Armatimonadia bacterium]|nr:hypothetical protein [Armatimonadia bacterium]